MKERRLWRIIPKIRYIDFDKEFPNHDCFKTLFWFKRYWSGRIWKMGIKAKCIELDFRYSWISDMVNRN